METEKLKPKIMIDLEMLNLLNAQGCAACGGKFTLGETAVAACGPWGNAPRYVHESEAVQDAQSGCYTVR